MPRDTEGVEHLGDDHQRDPLSPTCDGIADIPGPIDDDQDDQEEGN